MAGEWLQVSVDCTQAASDQLEQWLFEAGALSVTLRDSVDDEELTHAVLEPTPGEVRLWAELTLVGLFAQDSEESGVQAALQRAAEVCKLSAMPEISMKRLADQIWERTWMDSFRPMQFGPRLWICPSQAAPVDADAITLRLDPGMAFGTGTHATTAQCLEWLGAQTQVSLQPLAGKTVIDFGCGSGVLAIASLLLGARRAWAVDIDPQAIQATRENARLNDVSARLSVGQPDILADVKADIVLANILFKPLMELSETLSAKVTSGGSLVMSGILEQQMQPLRMRYNDEFEFLTARTCEGWALMAAVRR